MTITLTGFPAPTRVMAQGAEPWASDPWGFAGKTIGEWGCPGAALAEAQRMAGVQAGATPRTVTKRARGASPAVWAPSSSSANLPALARSAFFKCPDESWMTPAARARRPNLPSIACDTMKLSMLACAAIAAGGFAWLNVDYDADSTGDHWLMGFAFDADFIYCTDSAAGVVVKLDRRTLKAANVKWGKRLRNYEAVRGYPLSL